MPQPSTNAAALWDELERRFAELRASLSKTGTVVSVDSGNRRAAVDLGDPANPVDVSYSLNYTPSVGHIVKVSCVDDGAWLIWARVG